MLATILIASTLLILRPNVVKIAAASPTDPWAGYALLKHIASCESWGNADMEPREFLPNGAVLHGYPNPDDIGLGQINLPTWGKKAKELGFNLYTYDGNLAMTKWIFDHYGRSPWNYSKGCWG